MKKLVFIMPLMVISFLASCNQKPNGYTVYWLNEDGTELEKDENVPYGAIPSYNGAIPTKEPSVEYKYDFIGWSGDITAPIIGDTYFTAQYTPSERTYTVTWINDDGTVLEKDENVPCYAYPSYDGKTPTKNPTDEYIYRFKGWDKDTRVKITADTTFKALYNDIKLYEITFYDEDGTTVLDKHKVPSGDTPTYEGYYPTKPAASSNFYFFDKWSPNLQPVSGKKEYTATYRTVNVDGLDAYLRVVIPSGVTSASVSFTYTTSSTIDVDWGDGTTDTASSHTYTKSGEFDVKIKNIKTFSMDTVKYVKDAYAGKRLTSFYFKNCYNLKAAIINEETTEIKESFYGCSRLEAVNIPSSVLEIVDYAFGGCSLLRSITLPEGLQTLSKGAFESCSSLESIEIPASVTSISPNLTSQMSITQGAFFDCTSLSSIKVASENTKYDSRNDCNAIITKSQVGDVSADSLLFGCNNTAIPSGVKSILGAAFHGCDGINTIDIPSTTETIGNYAFGGCDSLTTVNLQEGLKIIGHRTFERCSSLSSINLPSTLTSIGIDAFCRCPNLTSIIIPSGIATIESETFAYCYSLASVIIPNTVAAISYDAFYLCTSLETIKIPNSVTYIGSHAFDRCDSLKLIDLTSFTNTTSIPSVGEYGFPSFGLVKRYKVANESMAYAFKDSGKGWPTGLDCYFW